MIAAAFDRLTAKASWDRSPIRCWRSISRRCAPALLFGLRLSAAVSLALFAAFFLELDNPSWAGTSASIVCQPILGASLRKGVFRLIGTVVGAIVSVLLTAAFPQDRIGFFVGMTAWCGACSFVSTLLRNFAAYAAMLAGYTTVIVASSSIAAPDQVFTIALSRATEICLGIVSGMLVMALTDTGRSADDLAGRILGLVDKIAAGVLSQLARPGAPDALFRIRRRTLIRQVAELDQILDRTVAESPEASVGRSTLRAGIQGLFLALSAWRSLGLSLSELPSADGEEQARHLRQHLSDALPAGGRDALLNTAIEVEMVFRSADACRTWDVPTPAFRLSADRTASLLEGLGRAVNARVLLAGGRALPVRAVRRNFLPDSVPPLVNAARVMLALGAGILFTVVTAWPDGFTFVTFLAVTVLLQSPRDEEAVSAAVGFGVGMLLTAAVAAAVKFAILPNHESFAAFAAIIGLALVPMAGLSTVPAVAPVFVAATTNFIPLLGPANQITYDTIGFANTALAIVGGSLAGVVVLRIVPPVPPRLRAARLLGLTLRDLRHLARHPRTWHADQWRTRVYGRLLALPAAADPSDGSQLLAALTIGLQLLSLDRETNRGSAADHLGSARKSLASGNSVATRQALRNFADAVAAGPRASQRAALRLQGAAREISEALATHQSYFEAEIA